MNACNRTPARLAYVRYLLRWGSVTRSIYFIPNKIILVITNIIFLIIEEDTPIDYQ
jgi:hypothetical protein